MNDGLVTCEWASVAIADPWGGGDGGWGVGAKGGSLGMGRTLNA